MRKLRWAYLFILILVPFLTIEVEAQRSALQIIYAVKLTDPASQEFHLDREAYTRAKHPFIERITTCALEQGYGDVQSSEQS